MRRVKIKTLGKASIPYSKAVWIPEINYIFVGRDMQTWEVTLGDILLLS